MAEEPSGIPFRITDDRELVVLDKKLLPLCEVLRQAAVDGGLAHVDVESHLIAAKLAPPVTCQQLIVLARRRWTPGSFDVCRKATTSHSP